MRIKISAGAERDIADGCDFYDDIDPNLATYFYGSISADIDSLLLMQDFTPRSTNGTLLSLRGSHL